MSKHNVFRQMEAVNAYHSALKRYSELKALKYDRKVMRKNWVNGEEIDYKAEAKRLERKCSRLEDEISEDQGALLPDLGLLDELLGGLIKER